MAKRGGYAKGVERREEILASAISVIAERGFRGATVSAVGREIGIEPAHILYYFGSREGLLRAVVERWDQDNDPRLTGLDLLHGYAPAIRHNQRIRGVVQLYLAFAVESIDDAHPAHDFFRERFRLTRLGLSTAIRDGQAEGVVRADLDPERTARHLIALADGLQLQWLLDREVDAADELDRVIQDIFIPSTEGLGAGSSTPLPVVVDSLAPKP